MPCVMVAWPGALKYGTLRWKGAQPLTLTTPSGFSGRLPYDTRGLVRRATHKTPEWGRRAPVDAI